MKKSLITLALLLFVSFVSVNFAQGSGKIKGIAKDAISGEPLIGANVFLKGTSIGTAANLKGEYLIKSVPAGEHILVASYIGYVAKEVAITITANRTLVFDFELDYTVIEGKELVVTAQAEGQMNAINRQLSAQSIKNTVSAKQIQEIPDANAAEAIGRLPGISLLRSGGEGSKVVIRGLSPQFTKVQVEGVSMSSTGEGQNGGERSTDLSMISPYMLEGIEVTKAALANQEADVIGGTVNFLLREAPEEFHFDVLSQSSFNGLKSEFGDYKFVLNGSNRFFNNKLGVFAQVDIEKRNRSSYELAVNYDPEKTEEITVSGVDLKDINRKLNRFGGTLVLDYKLPDGTIKFNSFISGVNKDIINRFETYNTARLTHDYSLENFENNLVVFNNSLKIKHDLFGGLIEAGLSYASSNNESPFKVKTTGQEKAAFVDEINNFHGDPAKVPSFAKNNHNAILLNSMFVSDVLSFENEIGANLDYTYDFNIKDFASISLQAGLKYKEKEKSFDINQDRADFVFNPLNNDLILEANPWMKDQVSVGTIRMPYIIFADKDYDGSDFLNGEYVISNMPQVGLMNDIANLLKNKSALYFTDHPISDKDDYNGNEYYYAGYVMPEIKFGQSITFIPGVRYEKNETSYSGARGIQGQWSDPYPHFDTTTTRVNDSWLPMIHLKYKPVEWFDIRLAYTETLSRPNYNSIVPSWNITNTYVNWNDSQLKPAYSVNYDIYASIYNNEIGLFTVGLFTKTITDMIFWSGGRNINDASEYGLPATVNNRRIGSMINNPNPVNLQGVELEWKTNFWYLPGIFSGLVLNINYTYTHSEGVYPIVFATGGNTPPFFLPTYHDSSYTDRLVNQPANILNITLGYDYKGFSTRVSFLYQDDTFKRTHFYESLRGISDDFYKFDVSVRQKLPVEGLEVIANFSNISDTIEQDLNVGSGYPLKKQQYGMTIDLGLRYRY